MAHAILLALAGLAAGVPAAFPALGGSIAAALLGLVLAAYLRLYAGVRSPGHLASVGLAAIFAYYVEMFVWLAAVLLLVAGSNHGNLPPAALPTALAGAAGAAVIGLVFLLVLPSGRGQLGLEIACCAIAGALAGCLWGIVWFAPVRAVARLPVWHGAVAGVLGLVAHLRSRPVAASTTALRFLAGAGIAGVCGVLAFGDALRAATQPPPTVVFVESEYGRAIQEARLKSLNEAPPMVDLPAIPSVPALDVFTPRPIAGFQCYPPLDDVGTPDPIEVDSRVFRAPPRHTYHLQCHLEKNGPNAPLSTVRVYVIQYPNDAWARYDLRNQDGYRLVVQDRSRVSRIMKHGRPIFAGRSNTYWASGDKAILIGGTAPPESLAVFIDAYLKRYPNTLEPEFDLPYLPLQ